MNKIMIIVLFAVFIWSSHATALQADEAYTAYLPIVRCNMAAAQVNEPPQPGGLK